MREFMSELSRSNVFQSVFNNEKKRSSKSTTTMKEAHRRKLTSTCINADSSSLKKGQIYSHTKIIDNRTDSPSTIYQNTTASSIKTTAVVSNETERCPASSEGQYTIDDSINANRLNPR